MRWAVTEWDPCPLKTIKNCFHHCSKQDAGNVAEVDASGNDGETCVHMERYATKYGFVFARFEIDALLNPMEEKDVIETFIIVELGKSAAVVKYVMWRNLKKPNF